MREVKSESMATGPFFLGWEAVPTGRIPLYPSNEAAGIRINTLPVRGQLKVTVR